MMTRSKIIATLGPASHSEEVVIALLKAGAGIFRLNMSHGSAEGHRATIKMLRSLPGRYGVDPVCIIGDLSGPKIRVGELAGGGVTLREAAKVSLLAREIVGDETAFHVGYPRLGIKAKRMSKVQLDDGMMELRVLKASPGELVCRVVKGGTLLSRKGVNFPGMALELPSITEKDKADLKFLLGEGVDYIALSFVREPSDIRNLKREIKRLGSDTPVIAKIERPEALKDIRGIIEAADGVMVARGDLGVEMPLERVPIVQRALIKLCGQLGKPVITATQMLDSMIKNPRPTRAEASDIADAVFEGTDALMLSGETAFGSYPEASVRMMRKIIKEAENHLSHVHSEPRKLTQTRAMAVSACRIAGEIGARKIICFTRTGGTALLVSKHRPSAAIIAATPSDVTYRRMRLYYGVIPVLVKARKIMEDMFREVETALLNGRLARRGELAVATLGFPGDSGTNMLKIHKIGEPSKPAERVTR
jgi:pyruvate kinase